MWVVMVWEPVVLVVAVCWVVWVNVLSPSWIEWGVLERLMSALATGELFWSTTLSVRVWRGGSVRVPRSVFVSSRRLGRVKVVVPPVPSSMTSSRSRSRNAATWGIVKTPVLGSMVAVWPSMVTVPSAGAAPVDSRIRPVSEKFSANGVRVIVTVLSAPIV